MLDGKNRRPGEFSACHQSAIEPAKVIGAAAQPKLRNEKCGFLAPMRMVAIVTNSQASDQR
jgi:hypothetical protein